MGAMTSEHPKCMTEIAAGETILSRQLKMISGAGITETVMTTGAFDDVLMSYCRSLALPLNITFVKNPVYDRTNYIYSIYCAREYLKDEDIVLMHGDLVFEDSVFHDVIASDMSCMTVSSTLPLPEKDFKAVISDGKVQKVGIEFFDDAVAAQPLYKLLKEDWNKWLGGIASFCESGEEAKRKCYAENALNEITDKCIFALDLEDRLCAEIDTPEDLAAVSARLAKGYNN